jgi:hypothetical protein
MKVSCLDGARVWSKLTSSESLALSRVNCVIAGSIFPFPPDTLRPAGFVNHFIRRNKALIPSALVFNTQGRFLLKQDPRGSGISHSTL